MSEDDLYLTDTQYLKILKKIKETVDQENFRPNYFDSTFTGDKYTESNCGLCNDNFTDKETALFPEAFPNRKSMKYSLAHHKCPFDQRNQPTDSKGCFYYCYLFQNKKHDLKLMRKMVDNLLSAVLT